MAKKISQLTQATEVKSDDVTVIVQDGETKKLPLNMMVTKQDIENKKVTGLAKLDEIEATYENDTYTPTITVKNKSSVKVGEGDEVDYSANVMDGHVKSAILKGQTLVNNLVKCTDIAITNSSHSGHINFSKNIEVGKEYTIIISISNAVASTDSKIINIRGNNVDGTYKSIYDGVFKVTNGIQKVKFTSTDNFKTCLISFASTTPENSSMIIDYLMFIEGDYINIDIPYFEGMQSVKLPVLTVTGKNLLEYIEWEIDKRLLTNGVVGESIGNNVSDYINVSNLDVITFSGFSKSSHCLYDKDKNIIGERALTSKMTVDVSGADYIRVTIDNTKDYSNPQMEVGSVATSYEPFKSNILTTPSDLTLRGIGDVQDTLDCLTGEVIERVGEIVLDGSEDEGWKDWWHLTNTVGCYIPKGIPNNGKVVVNNIPYNTINGGGESNDIEGYNLGIDGTLLVRILKSKLSSPDLNGFKEYLASNPIVIQYGLTQEVVKTVDLMPSGTHPSTTPYCWKNGHIQLSSSGLLPSLEYSVVTSRAGQINQNATMIVKNDKRIFDLEILLAGGLVNTTYQALTLQNQVETGLSKVSLNSETEPDYLLYHMIMKLIEEKAYKLDDLTEKVSVFYLYEKLSDEQFETIYSALYPFVEDEIVEEPVVEELPEVVEDEVIM